MEPKRRRHVGSRAAGYKMPRLSVIATLLTIIAISLALVVILGGTHVKETYTEEVIIDAFGSTLRQEYTREESYFQSSPSSASRSGTNRGYNAAWAAISSYPDIALAVEPKVQPEIQTVALVTDVEIATPEPAEPEIVLHFPESYYIKGAIMLTGEAGGVKSLTEQSGCLWTAINRVMSDDPFYPDDFEAVIEQAWQFDGYTPGGEYYEQCYELTVDVLERWYRELNGETAEEVGRTLPSDYLFFTGDGHHNYFTKVQDGTPYVWGSLLVSPYAN